MPGELIFEYDGFEPEVKGALQRLSKYINQTALTHVQKMMEMGALISEANEVLAKSGREGMFGAWIESECCISRRTAYNWMAAYERFGSHPDKIANLTAEAIYYLSSSSVDLDDVDSVLDFAKHEKVGLEQAKLIVQGLHDSKSHSATSGPEITTRDTPELDDDGESLVLPVASSEKVKGAECDQNKVDELIEDIDRRFTELVWALDELNNLSPQDRLHQAILDSLDVASRDFAMWQKGTGDE